MGGGGRGCSLAYSRTVSSNRKKAKRTSAAVIQLANERVCLDAKEINRVKLRAARVLKEDIEAKRTEFL